MGGDARGLEPAPDEGLESIWQRAAEATGLTRAQVAKSVAAAHGLDVWDRRAPEAKALESVGGRWASNRRVLPVELDERTIRLAVADPTDLNTEQEIRFMTGLEPEFVIAPPMVLDKEIAAHYRPDDATEDIAEQLDVSAQVKQLDRTERSYDVGAADIEGGPVVKLCNKILADAIQVRASDVHMGFANDQGIVRYRVDGILRPVMEIPGAVMLRAISRIKVIGGLDVGDRLRPQDGRCRVQVADRTYDLRISTVPTRGTEKAVLRILDPASAPSLEGIGMRHHDDAAFRELLRNREGIVIVTGPTGSGKTTTLYAALGHLATDDVNIMTVEDPVEYELAGLTQIQVNPRQGVTFASALRAVLRQDPDIVLVGEIRDLETAEIAVQAGLTGHLVLATLHTNDAIGSIRRLAELRLDRPSIAESLKGIVAQRLVRRLCKECPAPIPGDEDEAPVCERCGGTGYAGRAPVNEVVAITPALEELVVQSAPPRELYGAASQAGARSLRAAGQRLVDDGITSADELERVFGTDDGMGIPDQVLETSDDGGLARLPVADRDSGQASMLPEADDASSVSSTPAAEAPPSESPDTQGSPAEAGRPGSVPRILVVDDDTVGRLMISKTLRKRGYEIVDVAEGLEAIQRLNSGEYFDLVITDLDMPELSGRALLDLVRATPAGNELTVMVFTGSSDPEDEARLLSAGADDYMRKPIPPALFMARVDAALRRSHWGGRDS